jgi:hypothetical protein
MQNVSILATFEDRDCEKSEWLRERPIKLSWETGDSKRALAITIEDAENLFVSLAASLGIEMDVERDGEEMEAETEQ